jgi:hypothetical protein
MSEEVIEIDITEETVEVNITDGGEHTVVRQISVEMDSDPFTKTFEDLGLSTTISGAKIPAKPYVKNSEQGIIPVSCNDTGFTLALESVGPGTLPVIVELLIVGG